MNDKKLIIENITYDIVQRIDNNNLTIEITENDDSELYVNIKSDNPSALIGKRGETIKAIQHLVKTVSWRKLPHERFNILVDVDNYRKRQEENMIKMAQRKIDTARKTYKTQKLPPMSPYLRRKIHMLCTQSGYEDIETLSEGIGENRHLLIKIK